MSNHFAANKGRDEGTIAVNLFGDDDMTSDQPAWRQYEMDVAELAGSLDPGAVVEHNAKITGVISGVARQVDVLIVGTIGGHEMKIAIECKHYDDAVGIGIVDEFAGKLLDLGVERGVLYALSGLTSGAALRASKAVQPRIEVRDLAEATLELKAWSERIPEFTGFGTCQSDNCYVGDVQWQTWSGSPGAEAGSCDSCGTWAVRCTCDAELGLFWDEIECADCGRSYALIYDRKASEVEDVVMSPPTNDTVEDSVEV